MEEFCYMFKHNCSCTKEAIWVLQLSKFLWTNNCCHIGGVNITFQPPKVIYLITYKVYHCRTLNCYNLLTS